MSSIFTKTSSICSSKKDPKQNKYINSLSDENQDSTEPKILSIDEIKKIIPGNATNTPNIELSHTHIEWRWRFFNINGRNLIEMSKKHPGQEREYVDNSGRWVKYNFEESWDQYLSASAYHYVLE